MNLVRSYPAHRSTNVVGTIEILRFAARGQLKPVHFVSTLGVLPAAARSTAGCLAEGPPADTIPHDGYSQSKWVAEGLLGLAEQRGIPAAVYRLGEVMPHSQHGVPNPRGLADLIVRACLRVRLCFASPIVMDYTPVDYVGGLVAAAVTRGERGYFHVVAPRPVPLDELLAVFRTSAGLRPVAYPDFWRAVQSEYARHAGDQALGGLLAALPAPDGAGTAADQLAGLFLDGTRSYTTNRTRKLRDDAGVRWPEVDRGVFGRYVDYHQGT